MISRELLQTVLQEQWENFQKKDLGIMREKLADVKKLLSTPHVVVITGLRRVGKSTLLAQIAKKYLDNDYYYVNFEDERMVQFTASDFEILTETLQTMFGEKKVWLLDEIQNIPDWERFVRRMHDAQVKLVITGSNASLLSEELATRLTGRSLRVELYPFSFDEYLEFVHYPKSSNKVLTTTEKGKLVKYLRTYIASGGIAEALKYPAVNILPTLYNDVLHRDIVSRYGLENASNLKALAYYLASNVANMISFNKIKVFLKLGSVNTVKSYFEYLSSSWLFFAVNKFAYSVKEQQIAAKKVYCIDTGLAQVVGFSFSPNRGRWLENLVYLELLRRGQKVYYYKSGTGEEVDFYLPEENTLLQVAESVAEATTREREIGGLLRASIELNMPLTLVIITEREKEVITEGVKTVDVLPIYSWLRRING